MKSAVLSVLLLLPAPLLTAADKPATEGAVPGEWTMDLDAALEVAAAKKLPLLLNFTGSDWCGWCKHMDKEVFAQEAWTAFAQTNLLLVWIDFPKDKSLVPEKFADRNKALAERHGVEGYPTYIVLDDNGQTPLGKLGADSEISPEKFIRQVNALLQNRVSVVEKLLKKLPDKTAKAYTAAEKQRAAASDELKKLKASFEKRSGELERAIEAQEKRLEEIRLEARLAGLPKGKADAYLAKRKRLDAVRADINAWIATEPERTDANMQKFADWRAEVEKLEAELADLLCP